MVCENVSVLGVAWCVQMVAIKCRGAAGRVVFTKMDGVPRSDYSPFKGTRPGCRLDRDCKFLCVYEIAKQYDLHNVIELYESTQVEVNLLL